jgi:hypothetical protein
LESVFQTVANELREVKRSESGNAPAYC